MKDAHDLPNFSSDTGTLVLSGFAVDANPDWGRAEAEHLLMPS